MVSYGSVSGPTGKEIEKIDGLGLFIKQVLMYAVPSERNMIYHIPNARFLNCYLGVARHHRLLFKVTVKRQIQIPWTFYLLCHRHSFLSHKKTLFNPSPFSSYYYCSRNIAVATIAASK